MKIHEQVAEKIANSGEEVQNTVINKLAEIEISKRVDTLTKAVTKLDGLEKDLKKIDGKNDVITYATGGVKQESMSEKRFKEIEQAKKNVSNLENAINLALEKNDDESYKKLNGQLGGNKEQGSTESESK